MRFSKSFIPTLKEIPSDATVTSHNLMLRRRQARIIKKDMNEVGVKLF